MMAAQHAHCTEERSCHDYEYSVIFYWFTGLLVLFYWGSRALVRCFVNRPKPLSADGLQSLFAEAKFGLGKERGTWVVPEVEITYIDFIILALKFIYWRYVEIMDYMTYESPYRCNLHLYHLHDSYEVPYPGKNPKFVVMRDPGCTFPKYN